MATELAPELTAVMSLSPRMAAALFYGEGDLPRSRSLVPEQRSPSFPPPLRILAAAVFLLAVNM